MRVDGPLVTPALGEVAAAASALEASGYDGAFTFEGPHDPFLPLVLAADATEHLELTTAVAIAFARSPLTIASQAWDLQRLSAGRFHLGLGSQIRPHIERRFSMPWSAPAARMRELVLAIRAIWATWQDGVPLRFEGAHYTHTLMTPFFDPGPLDGSAPPVWLGGVGPLMTEVAGEVADGFMVHPFCTERSLVEVTLPALERGRARPGAIAAPIQVSLPVMIATGCRRGGDRRRQGRRARPDRLLRLDARVPGGARRARLGPPPAAAARSHPVGRLGGHGEPRT